MTDDNLPPLPEPVDYGYREEGTWVQQLCFTHDQMHAYARAAILAERERCALICEGIAMDDKTGYGIAEDCAAAIREGGK